MMTSQEEFLAHYGIKGMKWGVRRTASQLKRAKGATARTRYKKAPKNLSEAELNKRIKRMELEKKYNELNAGKTRQGGRYAQGILSNTGKAAAGAAVGGAVSFLVQRELKRRFPKSK